MSVSVAGAYSRLGEIALLNGDLAEAEKNYSQITILANVDIQIINDAKYGELKQLSVSKELRSATAQKDRRILFLNCPTSLNIINTDYREIHFPHSLGHDANLAFRDKYSIYYIHLHGQRIKVIFSGNQDLPLDAFVIVIFWH